MTSDSANNFPVGPFTIRRHVDVKRLKHQLWEYIEPKILTVKAANPSTGNEEE